MKRSAVVLLVQSIVLVGATLSSVNAYGKCSVSASTEMGARSKFGKRCRGYVAPKCGMYTGNRTWSCSSARKQISIKEAAKRELKRQKQQKGQPQKSQKPVQKTKKTVETPKKYLLAAPSKRMYMINERETIAGKLEKFLTGTTSENAAGGYALNLGKGAAAFYDPRASMKNVRSNPNRITGFKPGVRVVVLTRFGIGNRLGGSGSVPKRAVWVTWGEGRYGWMLQRKNVDFYLYDVPRDWKAINSIAATYGNPSGKPVYISDAAGLRTRMSGVKDYAGYTHRWKENTSWKYTGKNAELISDSELYGDVLVRFRFEGHASYFEWIPKKYIYDAATREKEYTTVHRTRDIVLQYWPFIGIGYLLVCTFLLLTRSGGEISGALSDYYFGSESRLLRWVVLVVSALSLYIAVHYLTAVNLDTRVSRPGNIFDISGYLGVLMLLTIPILLFIPTALYSFAVLFKSHDDLRVVRKNTEFTTSERTARRQRAALGDQLGESYKDIPSGPASRSYKRKMTEAKERLIKQRQAAEEFNRTAKAQHESHVRAKYQKEGMDE